MSLVTHAWWQTRFKGFNISEIIKAGSLGHGTAVPGHYNIDLVIYSRGIYMYTFLQALYSVISSCSTNCVATQPVTLNCSIHYGY